MILQEKYTLYNGVEIPKLGLGTWFINNENVKSVVEQAINLGYRHIDTAQAYGNEEGIGQGIKSSGINRSDLFITTKIAAEIKSYDEAVIAINESLVKLDTNYVDLMIIHSPKPWNDFLGNNHYFKENLEVWRALEKFYSDGKLKSIGVSNFEIEDAENILTNCNVKPMVNQILTHISSTPIDLINYCQRNSILVEAYSPIAHGELMKNQLVVEIAARYGVTVPQLAIRYCLELGLIPLPKTENPTNMRTNADVDFSISSEDIQILKSIKEIENYGDASIFPVFGKKH